MGSRRAALIMVFGLVAVSAVVWEFLEFTADALFHVGAQRGLADTMKDQLMGLLGGIAYVAAARRRGAENG